MKKIMLTMVLLCVTILLAGCMNGNLLNNVTSSPSGESGEFLLGNEIEEERVESVPQEEVYEYNESGKIIIVMYHTFAEKETNEYSRSFENFRKDLEHLYDLGYRTVSLNDYLNSTMKVPVGCTPIVFTFDDGTAGQFHLIQSGDQLIADPQSAVGIMEAFYEEHPDFGLNGTFFINGTAIFGGEGTLKERLNYLIQKGFEIGNHTNTHVNFSKASVDTIQKEIGIVHNMVKEEVNYEITSLALPYGIGSKGYSEYLHRGEYDSIEYENKVILLVGAEPVLSANSEKVNLLSLPRVRARGGNQAVACDLYWWLERMEENPALKYQRIA